MTQNSSSASAPTNPHASGRDTSEITGGWNWGAFWLSWVWALCNNVFIGVLALAIPFFNIILAVKGNEWAWNNKAWESVESFKENQRKWAIAGWIWAAVLIGLFTLLVLAPDPPKEPEKPVVLRTQPANTEILTDNKAKFTLAYPTGWQLVPEDELELLNTKSKTESDKKLKEYISTYLYEDPANIDATLYVSVKPHNYVDSESAFSKINELEEDIAEENGNQDVKVTKTNIKIGQRSDIDAVLYEYEDALEKGSILKYHNLRLVTAANGNYYYVFGSTLRTDWEKYKQIMYNSVTSINPMEGGEK